MTRAELLALAERVEAATGPDRALDEEIDLIAYDLGWRAERKEVPFEAPRYTASIDAAASLVPEGDGFALIYNAAKVGIWVGKGKTPALALLAACLFARAEEAAWDEREDTAALRARAEEAGE